MKAEQRKELETNTLADRMGQVVTRVKTSPRRTFMIYLLVTLAVLVAVWLGWRWYSEKEVERSRQWIHFYDGAGHHIEALAKDKDTHAGKAARFQEAWLSYWDHGIKMLATDKAGAIIELNKAVKRYGELAEECKDDAIFEPQALLGRAVAMESLAVQDRGKLDRAAEFYEELTKIEKYEKSAEARFAQDRLKILQNKTANQELKTTYKDLQELLGIPAPMKLDKLDRPFGP